MRVFESKIYHGFTTTAFVERDIYVFDHWILGWGFVTMDDKNPGSSPV
jgi:hypothetical protein